LGAVEPERAALVVDHLLERGGEVGGAQRRVGAGVRDAEAAAEVQLGELDAGGGAELRGELERAADGHLESERLEDLRADVAVDSAKVQVLRRVAAHQRRQRLSAHDAEPELLVLVGGGDVLVRVGLDARGDAHEDRRPVSARDAGRLDPVDLVEGVHDDPPDALLERERDLLLATCCCRAAR